MKPNSSYPPLGLRANWSQFWLLVLVNAFVGGMVGLERTILPQLAEAEFGLTAKSVILSFIVVFGVTKAITNYYTGRWANKLGRRNLLLLGWIVALPIPFILMMANTWSMIIFANVLLGINQGLAWSSTVVMKIDLVGEKARGFAMGLNEFAGYLSVSVVAFLTGWIASQYGLRPYPFYLGILLVFLGLTTTFFFIKETKHFVQSEGEASKSTRLNNIFWATTFKDKTLSSVSQAGLINNLNDGMVWGIFPLLLIAKGFSLKDIAIIVAVYPAVWGLGQLFTGRMADLYDKKKILFWGMLFQGLALLCFTIANTFVHFIVLSALLGLGTALVYPTFLATIAEHTHPEDRAESIGVFRLWRDLGYAIGAILTGFLADFYSINTAILAISILTLLSAIVIQLRMYKK